MMNTRELMEKYGIRADKSLGQNFLHRDDIIADIAAALPGCENALEIGAGLGVLTYNLCSNYKKVATIEIDRSLEAVTGETLKTVTNHKMIYGDFLRFDLAKLDGWFGDGPLAVVGNLPYNITGEILTKLIKNRARFTSGVIMVQKEVAQKLMSPPSRDSYRAISVLMQYFTDITYLFDVPPDCFIPAPKVTSAVIRLDFKTDLEIPREKESEFIAFIHRIFSHRRKLLTSIFHNPDEKARAKSVLKSLGYAETVRGEALSPDCLAKLFLMLYCEQK